MIVCGRSSPPGAGPRLVSSPTFSKKHASALDLFLNFAKLKNNFPEVHKFWVRLIDFYIGIHLCNHQGTQYLQHPSVLHFPAPTPSHTIPAGTSLFLKTTNTQQCFGFTLSRGITRSLFPVPTLLSQPHFRARIVGLFMLVTLPYSGMLLQVHT